MERKTYSVRKASFHSVETKKSEKEKNIPGGKNEAHLVAKNGKECFCPCLL